MTTQNCAYIDVDQNTFYKQISEIRPVDSDIHTISITRQARDHLKQLYQDGELILFYQPQVRLTDQRICAIEVLLRHKSHQGQIMAPTFLSSFSTLNMMPELDRWVIKKALQEVSYLAWLSDFKVSINVSPQTFLTKGFTEFVLGAIESSDLDYSQIELEVTEDALIQSVSKMRSVVLELKRAGVSIALDDFGAGYSSIGNLVSYDYDKIKIDRSLVANIAHQTGREMFRLTTDLARLSGANVIIEGVESLEELEFVRSLGIEYVQGYYFYKPMDFQQVCAEFEAV